MEWDSRGKYKDLIDTLTKLSKGGDVRVYRISRGGVKAEYWALTVVGAKLMGVKALAVES